MILHFSNKRRVIVLLSAISLFSFFSCEQKITEESEMSNIVDSNQTQMLNVNGEIFSIPSPFQTAFLIKQTGNTYNKEMLNASQNFASYSTEYQKALNLGVYGADLGYVTLYDQTQDAIAYMQSVKRLGDELGVTGAFDTELMKRFQNNVGKRDSLLVLVSSAYRACDAYLKNNERNDISALILVGGWIESLHFATTAVQAKNSPELTQRIAEQKASLQSLINLLTPYSSESEYIELIDNLQDLSNAFEGVEFKYIYEKPSVDVENKTTNINSKTEVKITNEQIEAIYQKVQSIRNQITG